MLTKGGEGRVATATVSGALTGVTVPSNARVALVYRGNTAANASSHSALVVGSDVAVVGGKFTMNLGVPADDLFSAADDSSINTGASPPTAELPQPAGGNSPKPSGSSTSGSPGAFGAAQVTPLGGLVGGSITQPLTAAVAGFVVYADTNGNGQLDLEGPYASSPDQILGGNKEQLLVYLKGGGSLDYEKLRDKAGILPTAGFDLAWREGRWLPLTDVELKLSANAQLPGAVCASGSSGSDSVAGSPKSDSSGASAGSAGSGPIETTSDGGTSSGSGSSSSGSSGSGRSSYPSPSDPDLHCSPDGRSFTYTGIPNCPPSPPPPTGLCAGDGPIASACGGLRDYGYGTSLASGAPVPDGWPCPVSGPSGSSGSGGGAADPSVDAGSRDGS